MVARGKRDATERSLELRLEKETMIATTVQEIEVLKKAQENLKMKVAEEITELKK